MPGNCSWNIVVGRSGSCRTTRRGMLAGPAVAGPPGIDDSVVRPRKMNNGKRMNAKKIIIALVIFGSVAGILIAVHSLMTSEDETVLVNPYEYDVSDLTRIDPSQVKYTEIRTIETGMSNLNALAMDSVDQLYVTGTGLLRVYDMQDTIQHEWKLEAEPECIAVAPDGTVYLGMRDHVEVYDLTGERKQSWPVLDGTPYITALAVTTNYVFIADYGNRRVLKCTMNGTVLGTIGDKDPGRDIPGFVIPSPYFDLALGTDNTLWVVNPGRHLLQNFTYSGDLRSSWGKSSMALDGFCGCCNPSYIAILPDGTFVTSEKGLERVKIYTADGSYAGVVAGPEQFSEGTAGLDLAVDSDENIYILDPAGTTIRIFARKNLNRPERPQ